VFNSFFQESVGNYFITLEKVELPTTYKLTAARLFYFQYLISRKKRANNAYHAAECSNSWSFHSITGVSLQPLDELSFSGKIISPVFFSFTSIGN